MAYENILVEREDNVAIITLNRPKVLNALNDALVGEIDAAIDDLAADEAIRAIIFTGAGDRAFGAGADINELRALPNATAGVEKSLKGQRILLKIQGLPKPVIMAINGFALGGGLELAMSGDIRIASEAARFGQPEINLGIIPGYGGTQRLPRLVGRGMALWLVLSGEMIDAQEALRLGLVEKVVPADQLMPLAKEMARKLADKAPIAVAAGKRAINGGLEMPLDHALEYESSQFGIAFSTEDRIEGTSAFLEKRKAQFKGR